MSETIKIKSGVDIKLQGKAEQIYANAELPETFALKPTDFKGVKIKLSVREGDEVKAGTPLLFNREQEAVKFCAPVSGEVVEIVRGEKRKLLEVRILADKETKYHDFGTANPESLSGDDVKKRLLESGCWPFIKQRPYNIVANPERTPKHIYISCFDSAPLACENDFTVHGFEKEFQTGVNALAKLTEGKVHLGLDGSTKPSKVFTDCQGVVKQNFKGAHPAGNVGVQIHHTNPINKGEVFWTLNPQDVIIIGRLFLTGKFDASINVAMGGSQVTKPRYYKTIIGGSVKNMVASNTQDGTNRYIAGNVLTGDRIKADGYLGFYDRELMVLPEGIEPEFFGWLNPGISKFSISRTLMSWMTANKAKTLNTSLNGEGRAFVVTGEYEKVFPFDIFPVQLLKSILIKDIEAMENLGIYELVEEDMALCEVVCTSKTEVQKILRDGLDLMYSELGD